MPNFLSRLGGGFAGLITGAITAPFIATYYDYKETWDYYENGPGKGAYVPHIMVTPLIRGMIIGPISGVIRGAYIGFNQGINEGVNVPAALKKHHSKSNNYNATLIKRIAQCDKNANFNGILSEGQIKEFENYLSIMENEEQAKLLSDKLFQYNQYMEQICPFTQLSVKEHKMPLIIKSTTDSSVNIVCNYEAAIKAMEYTFDKTGTLGLRIEEPPVSQYKIGDIISTGFPKYITDFVSDVKNRLFSLNKIKKTISELQRYEENYVEDLKVSPNALENKKSEGIERNPKLWVNPNALFVHSNLFLKNHKEAYKIDHEQPTISKTVSP